MSKKLTGHLTQPLWFQSSLKLHQRQEVSLSFHLFCAHLPRSLHRSFPSGLCGFPLVQQKVGEKTNATKTNHPTRPCGQGWEGSSKAARPPPCHGSTTVSPIPRHRAPTPGTAVTAVSPLRPLLPLGLGGDPAPQSGAGTAVPSSRGRAGCTVRLQPASPGRQPAAYPHQSLDFIFSLPPSPGQGQ